MSWLVSLFQLIHAHSGPVIAVSVSPDGKFLVSYSHIEQKIKFWQVRLGKLIIPKFHLMKLFDCDL